MRYLKIICIAFVLFCTGCSHVPKSAPIAVPATLPPANPIQSVRVALVLGGGGARGLAHAGVLEVLEREQIPIDLIVGTSAGSIIGALYADDPNAYRLKNKIIHANKWTFIDLNWRACLHALYKPIGVIEGHAIRRFLQQNLTHQQFDQLPIPFVAVATDLHKAETVSIHSGPIIPAVHASSALPMIFSPVKIYGKTLVDGGVSSPVPVEIAAQFAPEVIIAVDITHPPLVGPVRHNWDIGLKSLDISYFQLAHHQTKMADVLITPDINGFGIFSDHANEALYAQGQAAAEQALAKIRQVLQHKKHHPNEKTA